ncbi:phosphoribosylamine--glycine ligase [Picrophilus oshimae]|uniref:phosphoribosylamine--glycine ligase n=1 Tax=Picrophilus torridus (strain ATCC 700027 / DSM 9790 / JCM 10055 / NBRC 100828 / KAW 2/3) TaxID=1122961 RepID=A0A8G2FVD6_PICTO|nr:phosphoribosylamine--glycine ligase [Picrophilus oshimae]SMD30153.1 phosphoribosylamine--glycine ligase [Picrophilus oshimae DSM 9789]
MKIMLVGSGGREDSIARNIALNHELYSVLTNENPSIIKNSKKYIFYDKKRHDLIADFALKNNIDIAFVSPDGILANGLADDLIKNKIKTASPVKSAAMIETSKAYMRYIMEKYNIPGNIENATFNNKDAARDYITSMKDVAVKPIGLTGGKGVKVTGIHLNSDEAVRYACDIIDRDGQVLIEKKETGEEFSLQAFSDGSHLSFMPVVQDYKRLYEGDHGPNTGGMGSISDRDFSLPFLRKDTPERAKKILNKIIEAMKDENNAFKGIIYGQFMETDNDVKVIEINARFGDPEAINVNYILDDDLGIIFHDILSGNVNRSIKYMRKATVLKYIVPPGYPENPSKVRIKIDKTLNSDVYYASVSGTLNDVETLGSRSIAIIARGDSIEDAYLKCESDLNAIHGEFYVRHDIGDIRKKIKN